MHDPTPNDPADPRSIDLDILENDAAERAGLAADSRGGTFGVEAPDAAPEEAAEEMAFPASPPKP